MEHHTRDGSFVVNEAACPGCEWLMLGRWAPWCAKAERPLLFVDTCPCPRERLYYDPMDVDVLVQNSRKNCSNRKEV